MQEVLHGVELQARQATPLSDIPKPKQLPCFCLKYQTLSDFNLKSQQVSRWFLELVNLKLHEIATIFIICWFIHYIHFINNSSQLLHRHPQNLLSAQGLHHHGIGALLHQNAHGLVEDGLGVLAGGCGPHRSKHVTKSLQVPLYDMKYIYIYMCVHIVYLDILSIHVSN